MLCLLHAHYLTVVFITNAINLIDGIDGLASGLSSVALMVLGFLFIEKGLWIYSMLAFSTLGVLIPFFYYNVFGSAERDFYQSFSHSFPFL